MPEAPTRTTVNQTVWPSPKRWPPSHSPCACIPRRHESVPHHPPAHVSAARWILLLIATPEQWRHLRSVHTGTVRRRLTIVLRYLPSAARCMSSHTARKSLTRTNQLECLCCARDHVLVRTLPRTYRSG